MIQASGREDTAPNQSKVLVHILKIRSEDLGMADGEGLVFQDVQIQRAHIHTTHVSLFTVQGDPKYLMLLWLSIILLTIMLYISSIYHFKLLYLPFL
jgi:hypothetical protein